MIKSNETLHPGPIHLSDTTFFTNLVKINQEPWTFWSCSQMRSLLHQNQMSGYLTAIK